MMLIVTTVAAVLSAFAATAAALFSAFSYRREWARDRTVVEAQPLWHPRGLPVLPIVVRNQGNETLTVTAAEIQRPKGSAMAVDSEGLFGLTPPFKPPERQRLKLNFTAFPVSRMHIGWPPSLLNEAVVPLYFQPPGDWYGGWIKVRIAVASTASKAKPRWITVRRYLHKRSPLVEAAYGQRPQETAV
jgi:hypothetical protein